MLEITLKVVFHYKICEELMIFFSESSLSLLVFILVVYFVTSLCDVLDKKNVHIVHIRERNKSEIQVEVLNWFFFHSPSLGERLTTWNRYCHLRNKMCTAFIKCSPIVSDHHPVAIFRYLLLLYFFCSFFSKWI